MVTNARRTIVTRRTNQTVVYGVDAPRARQPHRSAGENVLFVTVADRSKQSAFAQTSLPSARSVSTAGPAGRVQFARPSCRPYTFVTGVRVGQSCCRSPRNVPVASPPRWAKSRTPNVSKLYRTGATIVAGGGRFCLSTTRACVRATGGGKGNERRVRMNVRRNAFAY